MKKFEKINIEGRSFTAFQFSYNKMSIKKMVDTGKVVEGRTEWVREGVLNKLHTYTFPVYIVEYACPEGHTKEERRDESFSSIPKSISCSECRAREEELREKVSMNNMETFSDIVQCFREAGLLDYEFGIGNNPNSINEAIKAAIEADGDINEVIEYFE